MIEEALNEIRASLLKQAKEENKAAMLRLVPGIEPFYGVRATHLDKLAQRHKHLGYQLTPELWKAGYWEERILAAKILSKMGRYATEEGLRQIQEFSMDLKDWASCDALGMQAIRPSIKLDSKQVWNWVLSLLKQQDFWQRRLGLVILTHYAKKHEYKERIQSVIAPLAQDQHHYVKKAITWVKKDLRKADGKAH